MGKNEIHADRVSYYRTLCLFFLLAFVGLSISVLGYKYDEELLVGAGAIWILATAFGFRSSFSLKALAGAFVGLLVGVAVGAGIGLTVMSVAESLVAVIGGAAIGALVGMVLVGGVLYSLEELLPVLLLPRVVTAILLAIGALVGGLVGIGVLRETVTKVYGPIGGGIVAIGSLGLVVGFLAGRRLAVAAED